MVIKAAIFASYNLTEPNAASLIVNEPLKHLVKFKDLEIDLIAPNNIPDDIKNGLKHIRYTMYNKPILRFISSFSAIPKLLRDDYDLYYSAGLKATSILLIARKMKSRKLLTLCSGFEIEGGGDIESKIFGRKSYNNKISGLIKKFRMNMMLKYSDGLIVRSEGYKKFILKHDIYKNKIFVIPYAVDTEFFGRKYGRDLLLIDELGLKNKKVIMYTGEITALHGVLDLVKAIEIINSKIEDVVALVIVGDGSWAPMIREYVKKNQIKNVIFTGRVPHEKVPYYHSIADVLVIPHVRRIDSEVLYPSKLLECLASGKPIVASNLRAIADVVGDNAILVEPEKPRAFADGILTLLNDEVLAKKMGENGKKIIYNYSWEEIAEKTYEAYKDLLSSENQI